MGVPKTETFMTSVSALEDSPMPSPGPLPDPTHATLHTFVSGMSRAASQHPWLVVALAIGMISAVIRPAREVLHNGPRDAVRRFNRSDKATLLALAGYRCEHHSWLGGRCRSTKKLEADHIHPHSRGG